MKMVYMRPCYYPEETFCALNKDLPSKIVFCLVVIKIGNGSIFL